ncbi:MAG: serine/threonine-protein kinase [Gemmataceae bacterium]
MAVAQCPQAEQRIAFVHGLLDERERRAFSLHASECALCQTALQSTADDETVTNGAKASAADDSFSTAVDEKRCRQFDQAWAAGTAPKIEDYLPPPGDPHRLGTLEEIVCSDIEFQWKARSRSQSVEPRLVADYCRQFPDLAASARRFRLVKHEFAVRHRHGDRPTAESYRLAHPDLAIDFDTLFRSTKPAASTGHPASIGPYRILGFLGTGGMGVVYEGEDAKLKRHVALKVMKAFGSGPRTGPAKKTSSEWDRFLAEAESLARLQHPNVVQIFEVGEADGMPYFTLELMTGGNLRDQCKGTPLECDAAARMTETLARAVGYLHAHGVVHRDLKPANVLLASDGTPKITDFGLAKILEDQQGQTQTGDILGTPSYMSPEQAAGLVASVGPVSDIYALGAILYELLTGTAPFRGATPVETVRLVLDVEPAPPSRLRPGLPRDLETICLKCLEKDPRRRYANAESLADDLGRFQRREPIMARPVGATERAWKWARRKPAWASLIALAVIATAVVVGGGWAVNLRLSSLLHQVEVKANDHRLGLVRMHTDSGNRKAEGGDGFGALTSHAESLRFSKSNDGTADLQRRRMAMLLRNSPRLAQLWTFAGPIRHVAFHSDGKRLAIACGDGAARIFDIESGKALVPEMRHEGYVSHVAFSKDGKRLLTASYDHSARVWDAESGTTLVDPLRTGGPLHRVAESPDGSKILTCGDGGTALWDRATGKKLEGTF